MNLSVGDDRYVWRYLVCNMISFEVDWLWGQFIGGPERYMRRGGEFRKASLVHVYVRWRVQLSIIRFVNK